MLKEITSMMTPIIPLVAVSSTNSLGLNENLLVNSKPSCLNKCLTPCEVLDKLNTNLSSPRRKCAVRTIWMYG